jgi:hypothetical protein
MSETMAPASGWLLAVDKWSLAIGCTPIWTLIILRSLTRLLFLLLPTNHPICPDVTSILYVNQNEAVTFFVVLSVVK